MPSRVRVAGLIGGRAYFGRQILGYLRNVADSAGVLVSNRKKGATWQDILAAWEVVGKYLDGNKLYVVRERRGVHASRSLFNQKLLGYRRNKKKKVAILPPWERARANAFWDAPPAQAMEHAELAPPMDAPPQELRRAVAVNVAGEIVYVNR